MKSGSGLMELKPELRRESGGIEHAEDSVDGTTRSPTEPKEPSSLLNMEDVGTSTRSLPTPRRELEEMLER